MGKAEEYRRRHGMIAERKRVGAVSSTDRTVEAAPRPGEREYRSTADDGFASRKETPE